MMFFSYFSSRLKSVFEDYQRKINQFKPIRQALLLLENQTRVLENSFSLWDPKRIIAFAPGICIEITLNPSDPDAPPTILIQVLYNRVIQFFYFNPPMLK